MSARFHSLRPPASCAVLLVVSIGAASPARAQVDPCERVAPIDVATMRRGNARIQEIMPQLNAIRDGRANAEMSEADRARARPLELEVCGLVSQAVLATKNLIAGLKSPACASSGLRADIPAYEAMLKTDLQRSLDVSCNPR